MVESKWIQLLRSLGENHRRTWKMSQLHSKTVFKIYISWLSSWGRVDLTELWQNFIIATCLAVYLTGQIDTVHPSWKIPRCLPKIHGESTMVTMTSKFRGFRAPQVSWRLRDLPWWLRWCMTLCTMTEPELSPSTQASGQSPVWRAPQQPVTSSAKRS